MQVISTGTRHLSHFQYAFNKTQEHLEDMGARIAPHKCYAFSSKNGAREWLRKHVWRRLRKRIPVINNCSDLGAHFNVSEEVRYGTTLSERLREAAESTDKLNFFRAPYEKKEKIIRSKLIPKGLFGCELGPINETAMRVFRTAVASCLTFVTTRRAVDLTFTAATRGNDVDPDIVVVCRTAAAARRAVAKDKGARKMMQEILERYEEKTNQGFSEARRS